jgi:DNA-binding transcriptional LysR family regulator
VPVPFRLLVVPGVTVDKWTRMWSERLPDADLQVVPAEAGRAAELLTSDVNAGIVRLPVDRDTVDAITLYTEVTVVVAAKDHHVAAADEVTLADLDGETLLRPADDVLEWTTPAPETARPDTTAEAIELVAAGVGLLVVPQSLARLHHRRDLIHRVVIDAPTSSVALAWVRERYSDLVEEMIGIVRGRTANSTRGRSAVAPAKATRKPVPARGPKARKPPPRRGR